MATTSTASEPATPGADAAAARAARRGGRRRGLKTWSALGELGRRPSEYEVMTHGMNHTRGAVPLATPPGRHGNQWLLRHRDATALTVADWDAFRDPDQTTYGRYVAGQDDQETYVEGLLAQFDKEGHDAALAPATVALLADVLTPARYVAHAQQMLTAYVQQLAPTSYLATAATFTTADQLRRVQLVAYRTTQLALTHPEAGFGSGERDRWQHDADWSVVRETYEQALVEFGLERSLAVTLLLLKPVADRLFLDELAVELAAAGDVLDPLILENLALDAARTRRWSVALVAFLRAQDAGNDAVLQAVVDEWWPRVEALREAGARIVARAGGRDAADIAASAAAAHAQLLADAGLSVPITDRS